MAEQKFQYVPPPMTPLDNDKTHLFTPSSEKGKDARLQIEFIDNNPRIRVYLNDQQYNTKEKEYGRIYARMDLMAFYGFLTLLESVVENKEKSKFVIKNKNYTFPYGKRSETPMLQSETYVGKDEDGVIWISVIAEDRPKLKFQFKGDQYHSFVKGDGTPFTLAEASKIHAKAWIETIKGIIQNMTVSAFVDTRAKREANNKSSGGGKPNYNNGNKSNFNKGGYNSSKPAPQSSGFDDDDGGSGGDDFSDDIPF